MAYNSVVISSGHGLYVRGACGIIDEVDEARKVVETLANELRHRGVNVKTYHDDVSYTQNENLNRIVDFHNSRVRDLDISVHFNAYEQVEKGMGTETLYVSQSTLACAVSEAIADAGCLIDRGGKLRTDLFFLNQTSGPSILIEICFVDSETDCIAYRDHYDAICCAIADVISGQSDVAPIEPAPGDELMVVSGPCSYFGGPDDDGVSASEGLAFIASVDDAPQLFLPFQPEETSGLARRLNPYVHYLACRWDYSRFPKETLTNHRAMVIAAKTGIALLAFPADWGPHEDTGRVADLSPSLMEDLGIETDDIVEVIYPYTGD